jgi:hypothetical protein
VNNNIDFEQRCLLLRDAAHSAGSAYEASLAARSKALDVYRHSAPTSKRLSTRQVYLEFHEMSSSSRAILLSVQARLFLAERGLELQREATALQGSIDTGRLSDVLAELDRVSSSLAELE